MKAMTNKDFWKEVGKGAIWCGGAMLLVAVLMFGIDDNDPEEKTTKAANTIVKLKKVEKAAPVESTTTTTVAAKPQVVTQNNPDLAICAQALYDMAPVIRSYFDAMRNYQSAYVLDSAEAEQFGVENERVGDDLYEKQWKIFGEHCDKYVTNRRPNNWG